MIYINNKTMHLYVLWVIIHLKYQIHFMEDYEMRKEAAQEWRITYEKS